MDSIKNEQYQEYVAILRHELVPALGCTEPIAIAYAAARCREILGQFPDEIWVRCSANVIKNVKSVVVPKTNNLKGIETSAVLGALAGDAGLKMEVLACVEPEQAELAGKLAQSGICNVEPLYQKEGLFIRMEMSKAGQSEVVEISERHTKVVHEEKNGQPLQLATLQEDDEDERHPMMTVASIFDFANQVDLTDIEMVLAAQVEKNQKIAQEGLAGEYGARIGKTLLQVEGNSVSAKAVAFTAAGSDARMGGCPLPVVINSGSGNQGMTASLPVVMYAKELCCGEEKMYRALVLSNLVAIYQKSYIGKLSAYCGVVSAACGSAAGIAYLHENSLDLVSGTIVNTIANISGMICDGAKASCAAKIATAVKAGIMGFEMARAGNVFQYGEGLVHKDVDATIQAFGRMGREGMRETDREILNIMTGR